MILHLPIELFKQFSVSFPPTSSSATKTVLMKWKPTFTVRQPKQTIAPFTSPVHLQHFAGRLRCKCEFFRRWSQTGAFLDQIWFSPRGKMYQKLVVCVLCFALVATLPTVYKYNDNKLLEPGKWRAYVAIVLINERRVMFRFGARFVDGDSPAYLPGRLWHQRRTLQDRDQGQEARRSGLFGHR